MIKHDSTSWLASGASETVLGVDNAKSGICCMYVCMDGMYASQTRVRGGFSSKNTAFQA